MARTPDLPASQLIRFLSAYGPDDRNANLFDEHVTDSARKYHQNPIEFKAEFVEQIVERLRANTPYVIFVTGVAGDGKSYHLRKVWSALGGDINDWNQSLDPTLNPGMAHVSRPIHFVKDLSANDSDAFLPLWEKLKVATTTNESFVIACNHGQILSRLNALEATDPKAKQCVVELQERFFRAVTAGDFLDSFVLFDLSRTEPSAKLDEIIQCIANLKGWEACEDEACPHLQECPIRKNLRALWNKGKTGIAAERLKALVKLSAKDGFHFPVRELLMLAVNAVLGASNAPRPLGNCHLVAEILEGTAKNKKVPSIDLFDNLLGTNANLQKSKSVFRRLSHFRIGTQDDPAFDNFVLTGKTSNEETKSAWERLFGDLEYPPKANDDSASTLNDELEQRALFLARARRRLFFSGEKLPPGLSDENAIWRLTSCPHFAQYQGLTKAVPDLVVTGLARIFTGISIKNPDGKIQITTNGAQSDTPVGELVVADLLAKDRYRKNLSLRIEPNVAPILVINPPSGAKSIEFTLTAQRFEYICGVAEGMLPTSFSSQCQSEFNALKSKIIRSTEIPFDPTSIEFQLIDECTISIDPSFLSSSDSQS